MTKKAAAEYKRILNTHLLVIDDIMMLPAQKKGAVALFNLINELHKKGLIDRHHQQGPEAMGGNLTG